MSGGQERKGDRPAADLPVPTQTEPRPRTPLAAPAFATHKTRAASTQAVTAAVVELADLLCTAQATPDEAAWRDGASLFKALRIAVARLSDSRTRRRPSMSIAAGPAEDGALRQTPSAARRDAESAVAEYWHHLHEAAREVTDGRYTFNLGDLSSAEHNPVYQDLKRSNARRQHDFLKSVTLAALGVERPVLSENIIKALNFHACAGLHSRAGEYRVSDVTVRGGFTPPPSYRVPELMHDLGVAMQKNWDRSDPVVLATFVLWRVASIHPFSDGNGRTARATSYYVLCARAGRWLPGRPILPRLIERNYEEYIRCLKTVDASVASERVDLQPLHTFVANLLGRQRPPVLT
jgi:hypothetical protein